MKIKKWFKEHPVASSCIIAGIGVAGCIVAGVCVATVLREEHDNYIIPMTPFGKIQRENFDIDEAIFTDVAPEIEEMLLADGVDEHYFNKTYSVKMPKNGDFANGFYEVLKQLEIKVTDIG